MIPKRTDSDKREKKQKRKKNYWELIIETGPSRSENFDDKKRHRSGESALTKRINIESDNRKLLIKRESSYCNGS
jgi:hypothetical protein